MITYIEVDAQGQIRTSGLADVPALDALRKLQPNSILIEVPEPVDLNKSYWSGQQILPFPQAPDFNHQWDWDKKMWVDRGPVARKERATAVVLKTRQKLYPSIGDQLDVLWKELGTGAKTAEAKAMMALITTIKLNNPKPN